MAKPSRMTLGHIVNEGGLKPHCWLIMAKNLGKLVGIWKIMGKPLFQNSGGFVDLWLDRGNLRPVIKTQFDQLFHGDFTIIYRDL